MENCALHEGFEKKIGEIVNHVEDVDKRVISLEKNTALDIQRLTLLLENLAKLPEAIDLMRDSLNSMQTEIKSSGEKTESLEKKLDDLNVKVCKIDENNTFSINGFIKEHFIGVIVGCVAISAFGTYWISNVIKTLMN